MPGLADRTFVQKVSDALTILGVSAGGGAGPTFTQTERLTTDGVMDITVPQTAKDLELIAHLRSARTGVSDDELEIRFNSTLLPVYQPIQWEVDSAGQQVENSVVNSVRFQINDLPGPNATVGHHMVLRMWMPDYRTTNSGIKNMLWQVYGPIDASASNLHTKMGGGTIGETAIATINLRVVLSPQDLATGSSAFLIGWGTT